MRIKTTGVLALGLLCGMGSALAAVAFDTYQTQSGFVAASSIVGSTQTTNFEAVPLNTLYASGTGPGGFTLSASASGSTPQVRNSLSDGTPLWTTSGTQFLGLNNNDAQFLGGDVLNIHFLAPVFGFGLYVITGADTLAGDLALSSAYGTVLNSGVADQTDGNGSYAYYLGMVASASFSDVTLTFGDGSFFFASAVDDIALVSGVPGGGGNNTVPEPSTLALLGLAGVLMAAQRRRQQEPTT
jgi:hypothetical protein|nr:PEP-CTERM sorting domain-containing protein [uncultured Albidiferax sp.]